MPSALDILYIVLAFCLLWLSAAMFWLIWQIAKVLKNINEAVNDAKMRVAHIEDALMGIKDRVGRAATSATVWVDGAKKLMDFAAERRAKKKTQTDADLWENK